MARAVPFRFPVTIRYLEVDQQGVVFNMWYLAWFDEAMTAFLAAGGMPYRELLGSGVDAQVVHTEIDWTGPVRYGDRVDVAVAVTHLGTTSFRLGFAVEAEGTVAVRAETAYVVISATTGEKQPIPDRLREVVGPVVAGALDAPGPGAT